MLDYIRRSDVLSLKHRLHNHSKDTIELYPVYVISPDAVEKIPSADVAEVVRCKDCKNNYVTTHNHGKQDDPRCDFTDRHLSLDDFCSRGERRMDGGT